MKPIFLDSEFSGSELEIEPHAAHTHQRAGACLLDVREPAEWALGMPAGAQGLPLPQLETRIAEMVSDPSTPLMTICGAGARSAQAALRLRALGYRRVVSVRGGFNRWREAGLPLQMPVSDDADFPERYLRHLLLPEIGESGQRRLEAARILLVGAGGLGSPAALYLAAAGVGQIGLVDNDRVDRSNLQRQILHSEATLGQEKVHSARVALAALNPRVNVVPFAERLDAGNVERILGDYELVIDGADNFPTRYLLSDACVKLAKPLVYGAIHRFEGQLCVFDAGRRRGQSPCYRCLFPEPPPPEAAPNCAQAGVLGVLPGVIGILQATEALKLLLGLGTPLDGRLLHFDALSMRFRETRLPPDPHCRVCAPGRKFSGYGDSEFFCVT